MSSNEKKAATLGMPHGTASSRLRKNILFHLLKKHRENLCFKCGELIEDVEDLSIEHKKPWEGISAELFWDLENIAFSHIRCNRPHKYHGGIPKPRPDGMSWCVPGQHFAAIEEFYKGDSIDGLQHWCKAHRYER
jgi:hypothetical protein